MKRKLTLGVLVAFFALLPTCLPAQNSPSLDETTSWIVKNLAGSGGKFVGRGGWNVEATNVRASSRECILTFSDDVSVRWHGGPYDGEKVGSWTETVVIPLGAITGIRPFDAADHSSVQIEAETEAFATTVHNTEGNVGHEGQHSTGSWSFDFATSGDNKNMAERMAKAVAHARDLCKPSYDPHPGEPF